MEGVAAGLEPALLDEFEAHVTRLRGRARERRESVRMKSVVLDTDEKEETSLEASLGRRQPTDEFQGDVNIRTLRALLKMVDDRGFERSAHQLQFHSAFERSTARVIYRDDWGTQRPAIMKKNGWATCSSEVLIRYDQCYTVHCSSHILTHVFIFNSCMQHPSSLWQDIFNRNFCGVPRFDSEVRDRGLQSSSSCISQTFGAHGRVIFTPS